MINYEQFKKVFSSSEKLPQNKDEFLERLYFFYKTGRKDRETEIVNNVNVAIKNLIK